VDSTSNALVARNFSGQKNRKDTNKARNNIFCDHHQRPHDIKINVSKSLDILNGLTLLRKLIKARNLQDSLLMWSAIRLNTFRRVPRMKLAILRIMENSLTLAWFKPWLKKWWSSWGNQLQNSRLISTHFCSFCRYINSSYSNICCVVPNCYHGSWIIDTGASDLMTYDLKSFKTIKLLDTPIHITLPDGSAKLVTHVGHVQSCLI